MLVSKSRGFSQDWISVSSTKSDICSDTFGSPFWALEEKPLLPLDFPNLSKSHPPLSVNLLAIQQSWPHRSQDLSAGLLQSYAKMSLGHLFLEGLHGGRRFNRQKASHAGLSARNGLRSLVLITVMNILNNYLRQSHPHHKSQSPDPSSSKRIRVRFVEWPD